MSTRRPPAAPVEGVVVDACMIAEAYPGIESGKGRPYECLARVASDVGIAVDVGHRVEQEWKNTCNTEVFAQWVLDLKKVDFIREVSPLLPRHVKKKLIVDYGFPQRRDVVHFGVALATRTRYILANDIHFYDPKVGRLTPSRQEECKSQRSGKLCRYMKDSHQLRVGRWEHVCADLQLPLCADNPPDCPARR